MISVLMANYNNGKYIGEAIESIKKQNYPDWELIIVDDCSLDNSIETLSLYNQDDRIKIFLNEKNEGCGFTKRKAAELSSGEYLIYLDPDDTLAPSALLELLNIHKHNQNCSVAYATNYVCDENLNIVKTSDYPGQVAIGDTQMAIESNKITHPALFKKSDYLKTEGINNKYKRAVDQDLYAKLEEQGRVIFLNKPLHYYRCHAGSISLFDNNIKAQYWNMKVAEDTYKRRKSKPSSFARNLTLTELRSIKFYYHKREVHDAIAKKKNKQLAFHFLKCFSLINKKTYKPLISIIGYAASKLIHHIFKFSHKHL